MAWRPAFSHTCADSSASEKMLRSRIHKWGLDKNHKDHEARAVLQAYNCRGGKPTRIRLRDQSVDIDDVERYFKRKRVCLEDVLQSDPQFVPGLVCETPPGSPRTESQGIQTLLRPASASRMAMPIKIAVPRALERVGHLRDTEQVFADFRYALHRVCEGSHTLSFSFMPAIRACYGAAVVHRLIHQGRPAEAVKAAFPVFDDLHWLMERPLEMILSLTQVTALFLTEELLKPMAIMLCRQLRKLAMLPRFNRNLPIDFIKGLSSLIEYSAASDDSTLVYRAVEAFYPWTDLKTVHHLFYGKERPIPYDYMLFRAGFRLLSTCGRPDGNIIAKK